MTLEIVTLLMIITGTVIIGFTYINIKKENAKNLSSQMNINEAGFEEYQNELNETALDIYKELDNKYQEILVIYEIIEKKYSEIKNSSKNNFSNNFNKSVNENANFTHVYTNEQVSKVVTELPQQKRIQNDVSSGLNYRNNTKIKSDLEVFNTNEDSKPDISDDNLAVKLLDEQLKEEKASNKQNKHSDVIELLKLGFNEEQIARELNIGTGEVLFVKELLKVKNEQK